MTHASPPTVDSSDEEKEEDEPEEQDVDDAEILEDLPDDTEVCHYFRLISAFEDSSDGW